MRNSRSFVFPILLLQLLIKSNAECPDAAAGIGERVFYSNHHNPYAKVLEPTLGVQHLEDLPGFTRSVYARDHALITPESQVFNSLPKWTKTQAAFLVTPAMGSHFTMFLAKLQDGSESALPLPGIERFVFVIEGELVLSTAINKNHQLVVDSFAYLPPDFPHVIKSLVNSTIVIFERRYHKTGNEYPQHIVGIAELQPVLETSGEVFVLRKLLPTTDIYDFNIHVMDFQPGEYLNVKEVHYNQHGLLLLEGRGIYRLGENWYPIQAGDAIWMAPFVPQWYAALGRTRSRYLLYKDINRDPLLHPSH